MISTFRKVNPASGLAPNGKRICPTCGASMEQAGNAWVCPVARIEARVISDEIRQSIRDVATERIAGVPF